MSKVIWKPGTLLAPVPAVLVSCGTLEKPNVLTIAWTGIVNSDPAMTYVSVRKERFSHDLIAQSGEFVINLTTAALARATDLCGVKSGRDTDKFQLAKLTPEPAPQLSCPMIAESPVSLECKVTQTLSLGSHDMFLAKIVAVNVDESLLDDKGKLHLSRCGLLSYAHGEYFAQGRRLGSFGCSVRKKVPANKRRAAK
ncbi:MAG: flavin reductase family protein [Oscillospiraceae bacterium]|nr:flavin reductase family protein [Oscillospiraceae bacterium]